MSRTPRHYRFADQPLEEVYAHGGSQPILTRRVLDANRGGHCNFLDLTVVPAGADIGDHTHTLDNEEIYVVVRGQGKMVVDGVEIEVGPGDVMVNRPGGRHGLTNPGPEELHLVVIELPTREDPP